MNRRKNSEAIPNMRQKEFLNIKAGNLANHSNGDEISAERAFESDINNNNAEKHKRTKTLSTNQDHKTLT